MSVVEIYDRVKAAIQSIFFWRNALPTLVQYCEPLQPVNCANSQQNDSNNIQFENDDRTTKKPCKKDLLDNLDAYFKYIKKMRNLDSESYNFYKKLGGQLIWGDETVQTIDDWASLPVRWKKTRPSFGCVMVEHDRFAPNLERTWLRFIYFRKVENGAPNIQRVPIDGDIYIVNGVYSFAAPNSEDMEREFVLQYPILITKDNECRVLLMKQDDSFTIQSKRPGFNKGKFTVHRKKWALPQWACYEAKEKNTTPEHILLRSFCFAAHVYEIAQHQMLEVRATKGNICARFAIKGDITSDLFREREVIGNRKKKIFHSVKPHIRKNGSAIKMHFRGERKFTWNGYSIAIIVPGKDYKAYLPEATFASIECGRDDVIPDTITMSDFADNIVDHMTKNIAA